MPELPEVETIKNDLAPHLVGRRFAAVEILWPGLVRYPSPEDVHRRLPGQEVAALSRRGKYLIARLGSGESLICHLKMTGALLLNASPDTYTRTVFTLDDGSRLLFSDKRKWAALWLVPDEAMVVGELGPEPLEPAFTPQTLSQIVARRSAPIKAVLMDQAALAGVGNMYADEALFQASIHPLRPTRSLSLEEVSRLHTAIVETLKKAIDNRGSTTSDYRTPDGGSGRHQAFLQVAHRGGEPCPRCGTPIQRLNLRNRGAYFCPRCQPEAKIKE